MTLSLSQSAFAVGINVPASFLGVGGVEPYTYAVIGAGAGGSINSSTGAYTAPAMVPTDPSTQFDTIQVTDSAATTATAQILVGDALLLLCDVIQRGMGLDSTRIWIWDQKIFLPTDFGLFVTVAEMEPKVVANVNSSPTGGATQNQYVTFISRIEVNLISRDTSARLRKGQFIASLNTAYAEQQQKSNSFQISKIPKSLTNVSVQDGAAIPYRYSAWFNLQYSEPASSAQDYFTDFNVPPTVAVNQ